MQHGKIPTGRIKHHQPVSQEIRTMSRSGTSRRNLTAGLAAVTALLAWLILRKLLYPLDKNLSALFKI